MLDIADEKIAQKLANRYLYPFALNIYHDIFKAYSHFPLQISKIDLNLSGKTVTYISWVVYECFNHNCDDFLSLFYTVRDIMTEKAKPFLFQDVTVETFLGCLLYYYHPTDIRSALSSYSVGKLNFSEKERYEFEIKKKTLLLFAL